MVSRGLHVLNKQRTQKLNSKVHVVPVELVDCSRCPVRGIQTSCMHAFAAPEIRVFSYQRRDVKEFDLEAQQLMDLINHTPSWKMEFFLYRFDLVMN